MGEIKDEKYYDDYYLADPSYSTHYTKSVYFNLWQNVIDRIIVGYTNPEILEIGCGTGQFAELLYDTHFRQYIGVDFSEVAIKMANNRVDMDFAVADLMKQNPYEYNLVLALEVLEHLDDITVLKNLEKSRIILTVPTFDCPSHVRHFNTQDEIEDRYNGLIKFDTIDKCGKYFIAEGEMK